LIDEGCNVVEVDAGMETTIAHAKRIGASWVALDGYTFGAGEQFDLQRAGFRVLFFDDIQHCGEYPADLVLNQNLGAVPGLYPKVSPSTRLLLGPDYALLRKEFLVHRGYRKDPPGAVKKILVSMGGSDPAQATELAARSLRSLRAAAWKAKIVVGAANPRFEHIVREFSGTDVDIEFHNDVADMSSVYRWADFCVGAGGTSTYERAFFQLPTVVVCIADNQIESALLCDKLGIGYNLGCHRNLLEADLVRAIERLSTNPGQWRKMSAACGDLVDGGGVQRVVAAMSMDSGQGRR
jgi:spore coat polysaccharide biosynthesis predicted glycosyltransferase SpsG